MARVNLSNAPYYDNTDMSKQYYQLLARPGHVAQAREFTEMQTTLREIVKSVGDSLLKNGDVVEGCQVIVKGTDVTVTSGKIYIDGIVMPLNSATVSITGVGVETIGVKLMEVIVDESTDNTLRDPAQGYDNYNQPGCTRLKRFLTVVTNDPDSAILSTLSDGSVMVESMTPTYDTLNEVLARRTYDESGSYIVNGLNAHTEFLNDTEYTVVVESGKAYVLGYEIKIPTPRRLKVGRSTTTEDVLSRYNLFSTGTADYILDSNPHVKEITSVNGQVSRTVNQTINSNLDGVLLQDTDVVQITSVVQGSTTYTIGSTPSTGDCYLSRSGNYFLLKWNGTENFPAPGSTYTVTYRYNKYFIDGTDYELALISGSHYIKWLTGGEKPINQTLFTVAYKQYLERQDIVYMDRYGMMTVFEGIPAAYASSGLPEAPLNTIVLASIYNPPNGTVTTTSSTNAISVTNVGLKRYTMTDIQRLVDRVSTMAYDQAVLSLNTEARNILTASDKKGIFTDSLIDFSKVDLYYNKTPQGVRIDTEKPVYDMAFDLAVNICFLPIVVDSATPVYNSVASTSHKYDRLHSLAVTGERVVLSQMSASISFPINPYTTYPSVPEVSVTPAVDNWIDTTIVTIPRTINATEVIASTRVIDTWTSFWSSNRAHSWTETSSSVSQSTIGVRSNTSVTEEVSESLITYIRPRVIRVDAQEFPPNLDNIKGSIDGVTVSLTPVGTTSSGTETGTVKADGNGRVSATFTIPSGIRCGSREVLLKSDIQVFNANTEGSAVYTAVGTARRVERTVTTVNTVLIERITTVNQHHIADLDPVGQTFVLDEMTLMKGIDIYFENKPSTNTPVSCEIRGVLNGNITSTMYGRKFLYPSEVSTSADATAATRFNFDDPILLEENKEYAFVLRSSSDDYRMWTAELGQRDVQTGNTILKNAYLTGVMFSSSNNSTWTAHQTTDAKFRIIADNYADSSTLEFDNIAVVDAARICLIADSAVPSGTNVSWSYNVNGGTFQEITPRDIAQLGMLASNIGLKAVLTKSATSKLSPLVALDTVELSYSNYDMAGAYISKNVAGLDSYTHVKIVVDLYEPAGTSMTVKFSTDDGVTLKSTTRGTSTLQSFGWNEVEFEGTTTASTQFRVLIEATSQNKFTTPAFRRLRCIMY